MKSSGRSIYKAFSYFFLAVGTAVILFPMYLTLITSLKTVPETASSFFAFPRTFYLGNFISVVRIANYFKYVFNSSVITCASVILIVLVVPMVSFSISRNRKDRYYKAIYAYFLGGVFIPFQVIMLPTVKIMSSIHLMNQGGLILLYTIFSLCEGTFLCVGYLNSVPVSLEEAAFIDGHSVLSAFFRIILPLMTPIMVTILIMNALFIWNDFQLPLVLLNNSPESWTIPLFQFNFKGRYSYNYNLAFASFLLSMLPIIIVYAIFQKQIVSGLTEGSVKN